MRRSPLGPRRRVRTSSRPQVEPMEARLLLATITVTGTGDTIAVDGVVTLREAITAANTNAASGDAPAGDAGAGHDRLQHPRRGRADDPPGHGPAGDHRPGRHRRLHPARGQRPTRSSTADNAVLLIEIDTASTPAARAHPRAGGSTAAIRAWSSTARARGSVPATCYDPTAATGIEGNFLGTDAAGDTDLGNSTRRSWRESARRTTSSAARPGRAAT